MNKFFSENLEKLGRESKLSPRNIHIELLDRGIHAEMSKIKSWFKGKVPEGWILEALARIFSGALKREVTVSELLGKGGER